MSKNFDDWMSHNEQRYAASSSATSPRGDDGMSYVSKKKHDNYANVVMEMKSQQFGFHQSADFDDFDDGFGFSSSHQQQQQHQQMGRSQSRQPSPSDWGSNQFETNNFQQQQSYQQRQQYQTDGWGGSPTPAGYPNSSSEQRSGAGRPRPRGSRDGAVAQIKPKPKRQGRTLYREHGNTNGASNQRSKSSIRRNAERTQALAKLNTDNDDDVVSDVWSSFERSGGATWAAAGSKLASTGQRRQQQQPQQYSQRTTQQRQTQQRQAPRRLDSSGSNSSFQSPPQSKNDEASISGSSVAARRRRVKSVVDSRQRQQQQQQQQQNQPTKPIALAPPPGTSAASTASVSSSSSTGARRNMRMRMQTKSSPTPSTTKAEVPAVTTTPIPHQQLQSQLQSVSSSSTTPNFERSSSMASMDSSEIIDNEVNMAMSELRVSGIDIDVFNNTNDIQPSSSTSPKKGRTSPITVGTKSLTLDSATIISSKGNEVGRGLVLSNTISVDQHSESSSLTNDTSDWQGQGTGNNMFKDANGSTFHKSKRIVRPNELKGVTTEQSQQQEQPQPKSPSLKDRISQYKTATTTSGGAPHLPSSSSGSPPNKLAQILKNARDEPSMEQEQSLPPLSPKVNRVKNSPFRQKEKEASDTSDGPSSPFRVKLRKTSNATSPTRSPVPASSVPSRVLADNQQKLNVDGQVSPNPFLSQSKLRKTGLPLTNNQQQEGSTEENDEAEPPKKDVATLMKERIAAANKQKASPPSDEQRVNVKRELSPPRSFPDRKEEAVSAQQEGKAPDPRAALMAMLNKRANPEAEEPSTEPSKALSSMIANRAPPALSSMLAKRAPQGVKVKDESASPADSGRPSLKNDPKYAKYMKMLKVGMPLPVVQHSMTRDGLDPAILEGDHNKPVQEAPAAVPLKEDPTYTKYFKMLKLGLPMGAVKNAMERDGVDSSVMDGDHNAPVSAPKPNVSSAKKKEKDTHRRTRLHWETLGQVNSNSVWAALADDEEMEQIEIDETEFTKLFQAEIKSTATAAQSSNSGSSSRNAVQVIDPKRANNGGIILARLRMSYDDMAKVVDNVDETKMTANQVQGIIEYMPTPTERKSLRNYMKSGQGDSEEKFEKLCECEKFMVAMISVKQSRMKMRALLFKLQFRGCIQDLAHDVFSVEKACDELNNSVKLRKLFGIVLNVGNRLNTAGPSDKRKASAFSIQSLLKLNQAKAFDNKTTFLQYVVLVVQRNNEKLLNFKDDLPTVAKADKIYWDQCINELEEMETQLEIVRKLALHDANSKKNIYSLPKKKGAQEDYDSDNLNIDEDMSLEEEVSLLRSSKIGMFALGAIKKVSQLRERVDIAKDKFARLLEYFGEDGDNAKMDVHELFAIINTFCRDFEVAREVVNKQEQAKKRAEKKEANAASKKLKTIEESSPPIKKNLPKKHPPMLKASSLQPSMSNVLAEMQQKKIVKSAPPAISDFPDDEPTVPGDETPSVGQNGIEAQELESERVERERQLMEQEATLAEEQRLQKERIEREQYDMEQQARVVEEQQQLEQQQIEQQRLERERIDLQRHAEQQAREVAAAKKQAQEQQRLQQGQHERERNAMEQNGMEVELQSSQAASKPQHSPKDNRPTSRRELMARRRQARFASSPQKSPVAATTSPKAQPSAISPSRMERSKAEMTTQKPTAPQSSSNTTARAAARDRYARHKKIMSQQRQVTTTQNDVDERRFAC
mmetsp:Transcript_3459/g.7245  ORF Transcript_3459/g.7245 Transcript_3459/m.7245 type:complete len:1710 (-) Transcript_3459:52-5181(-)